MAELQIVCLGEFQVTLAGAVLTPFQTDKNRALLLYLALETRVHQRATLAQFLWPGYSDESARNSLRQALHQLRQTLADPADTPWLAHLGCGARTTVGRLAPERRRLYCLGAPSGR